MSLGALYLIKEHTLRWLALSGGVISMGIAAFIRFTHTLAPGESHVVLLIPLIVGISMFLAGLLLKLHGLRVYFVVLFIVLGPGALAASWLACTTGLLSRAACG